MKITHSKHLRTQNSDYHNSYKPGFAPLLTVVTVGVGLLLILVSMYDNTVESQSNQKDHMMRADYQQREEAFLRALTNIIPNKAMICMQANSRPSRVGETSYDTIFQEALILSNSREALSVERANELGINNLRSGTNINNNFSRSQIINKTFTAINTNSTVSPGINRTATTEYPPPLTLSSGEIRDSTHPLVSLEKKYGTSAVGWVGADVDDYPLYNLVDAPSMHFNYQTGSKLIAKHNWWAFQLSLADSDVGVTKLGSRTRDYLISLYEIPSQLSVNGSSYTTLGTHTDGSAWGNINITGGIFAQRVKTEGSFSSDSISSRKGVEISEGTTVNGSVTGSNAGSNPFASSARELSQSKGETFPISSAANGGRVAFVPINRGLDFYDRFASSRTGNSSSGTSSISHTSWDYYSMGAQQCVMRLDIIDVVSDQNQTPISIRFTYSDNSTGSSLVEETFTKGSNWPDLGSSAGDDFPFHVELSATGTPCLSVYTERLNPFLAARGADYPEVNHSISINPDYVNNTDIQKPSFPAIDSDMGLLLFESSDMTTYTKGFSLVTNLRIIIADDVNVVSTTAPAGMTMAAGESFFPPISLFAPEKRYGDSIVPMKIEVAGQLGSLAKENASPVHIGDLKSGSADEIIADNITADLKPITHPAALPPINMMNWMIVIREIHPKYTPITIDETAAGGG